MILTLTPNPSIDATMHLASPLRRGQVNRPVSVSQVAGGKGVNVTHALSLAGCETLAVFPAGDDDPFIALARQAGIPFEATYSAGSVRINTTLTEDDGTTTKVNGLGAPLDFTHQSSVEKKIKELAADATHLVMAGSLPPGVPPDWYSSLIIAVREAHPDLPIAVDTSDEAMVQLGKSLSVAAPTIIKPNGFELGQLIGADGEAMEKAALAGDFHDVIKAAREIVKRGIPEVLVTLGGAGAILVTAAGAWFAAPPPVEVHSTVGAGDSSLAGYLLARSQGLSPADCLAHSVAYGTAAAGLPGTTIPSPHHLNLADTHVREIAHPE